ncbi:MAG: hypothetical protein J6Z18_07805 [Prevotella sp.]|nr:hypothetical protein [Prevotella sp.]
MQKKTTIKPVLFLILMMVISGCNPKDEITENWSYINTDEYYTGTLDDMWHIHMNHHCELPTPCHFNGYPVILICDNVEDIKKEMPELKTGEAISFKIERYRVPDDIYDTLNSYFIVTIKSVLADMSSASIEQRDLQSRM